MLDQVKGMYVTTAEPRTEPKVEPGFPIEPFDDVVYVEQVIEEVTKGGIVLPKTSDEMKMPQGRVVAVGPGRYYAAAMNASGHMEAAVFVPTKLQVGDRVVWGRYRTGGELVEIQGKRYVSAREGDLGGRILGDEPVTIKVIPQT